MILMNVAAVWKFEVMSNKICSQWNIFIVMSVLNNDDDDDDDYTSLTK